MTRADSRHWPSGILSRELACLTTPFLNVNIWINTKCKMLWINSTQNEKIGHRHEPERNSSFCLSVNKKRKLTRYVVAVVPKQRGDTWCRAKAPCWLAHRGTSARVASRTLTPRSVRQSAGGATAPLWFWWKVIFTRYLFEKEAIELLNWQH